MNRKVLIIYDENSRDISLSNFNETKIHFFDVNTEDDFYNFTIKYFSDKYDLIVIPCSLGDIHTNYAGIKLGICIRLIQDSNKNKYTPIIFISSDSFEEIYSITLEASILSAAGSYLSLPNKYKIESISMNAEVINSQVFKTNVLKRIFLTKPPQVGSHSIANEWGVYRLAKIGCYHLPKPKSNLYIEFLKNIYDYSEKGLDINEVKSHKINFKNNLKNISRNNKLRFLYIDDKKDKGWENVLKELLKDGIQSQDDLVSVTTEADGEKEIKKDWWDLIFLDLRLTEEEDNISTPINIENLTGGRLLKLAKKLNPSVPIIIFTASNKAWNLEKLFDFGADGYFIKESPEISLDIRFSIDNYKHLLDTISNLLERHSYLKWFWNFSKLLKDNIFKSVQDEVIRKNIEQKLDIAFGLLLSKQSSFQKELSVYTDFELAFLFYWSIINEIVCHLYIIEDETNWKINNKYYIKNNKSHIHENYDNHNPDMPFLYYSEDEESEAKNYTQKIPTLLSGIIFLKYGLDNKNNYTEIYLNLIKRLNGYRNHLDFIHSDCKKIKEEELNTRRKKNIEKRKENCENVCKLIYFLITGEDIP